MNHVTISFSWYDVIRVVFEPCAVPIMIVVWQEVRINKNVISRSHSKAMSANHYIPEIVIFGTDEHNWNKCKSIVLIKVYWYFKHFQVSNARHVLEFEKLQNCLLLLYFHKQIGLFKTVRYKHTSGCLLDNVQIGVNFADGGNLWKPLVWRNSNIVFIHFDQKTIHSM